MKSAFLAVALFTAVGLCAQAQSRPAAHVARHQHASTRHHLSAADLRFIRQAAASGRTEVIAGKLALTRAGDPAVRAFGEKLMKDHGAANSKLDWMAMDLGTRPPSRPAAPQMAQIHALERLRGPAFDRRFVGQIGVSAHQQAIALFRREADSASAAPPLRDYARHNLPVLQKHLALAQDLMARLQDQAG